MIHVLLAEIKVVKSTLRRRLKKKGPIHEIDCVTISNVTHDEIVEEISRREELDYDELIIEE